MTGAAGRDLLEPAVAAAAAAGELLLAYQRRRLDVTTKTSATDPVSEADHASEELIVGRLLEARPDDGILAEEEQANRSGTTGIRWVVDPLDGTVNFLYGFPQWCVSIAAQDDDGELVGVVHDPCRDETFAAARGAGARCGDLRLAVNAPGDLQQTLVATGFSYDPDLRVVQGRLAADLVGRARDIRRAGSAALDLAWVAAGRIDAYVEFGLSPWDWAAGRLLVQEAGGVVSTLHPELAGDTRTGLVAGGRAAHDHLAAWLRDTLDTGGALDTGRALDTGGD